MLETLPMWSNVQPQLQPHLGKPLTLSANVLEVAGAQVPRGSCRRESSANRVLSTIGSVVSNGHFVVRNLLSVKTRRNDRDLSAESPTKATFGSRRTLLPVKVRLVK